MSELTSLPCGNTGSDTAPRPGLRWIAVLVIALLAMPAHAAPVKKFKWLTPDGQTVFRPTPPVDPNQPYCSRLDDGPWTCYTGADTLEEPPPDPNVETAEERQRQADLLLRTRYRSLDDIERQYDEELDQVRFQRNVAHSNEQTQKDQLFQAIRAAADRQRAGMEVREEHLSQVELAKENLRMTQDTLDLIAQEEERLRVRHEARKARFVELMERYASP